MVEGEHNDHSESRIRHKLTVTVRSSDCTAAMLRLISALHRRNIDISSLTFTQETVTDSNMEAQIRASNQKAEIARQTIAGLIGVLSATVAPSPRPRGGSAYHHPRAHQDTGDDSSYGRERDDCGSLYADH